MPWTDEIDRITGKVGQIPDDDTVIAQRADLRDAGEALGAGTARIATFEVEIELPSGDVLGMGMSAHAKARGLYLIRADDTLLTRLPIDEWTPGEIVEAHTAMPDLLTALEAEADRRGPKSAKETAPGRA